VDRFITEHNQAGLLAMTRRLRKLGVTEVAIQRPDGPVVDALLEAGFTVVVIKTASPTTPPNTEPSKTSSTKINNGRRLDTGQLMGCRARFGVSTRSLGCRCRRVLCPVSGE
ncbi:MAG TPA: hypothetical protein VHN80_32150, partial [Kineosporiaceae bacterium]|nr:hypothetical protein [Kineosporiaceae bacterium]